MSNSYEAILDQRQDEISLQMRRVLTGLGDDWLWLDERIDQVTDEIRQVNRSEENCAGS